MPRQVQAISQPSYHRGRLAARSARSVKPWRRSAPSEKDGKLICKVQTLNINVSLAFLSNQNRPSPEAPAYRVFAGRSNLGAAWEKTSDNTRRTYYSVPLDDLTFAAPFFANLVEQNQGGFALIWSRAQRRDGDGRGAADQAAAPPPRQSCGGAFL